jgi:hypothetical protein
LAIWRRDVDDLDRLIKGLPGDEQRAIAKRADELIKASPTNIARLAEKRSSEVVEAPKPKRA